MQYRPFSRSYRLMHYASLLLILAVVIVAAFLLTYVLAIIAIVGAGFIGISFLKQRFFSKQPFHAPKQSSSYRVIDHE